VNLLIRADASLDIGAGHIMRCLSMADGFRARGFSCAFVCREHPGNLIRLVQERGYPVHALPLDGTGCAPCGHAGFLGADWKTDVQETVDVLDRNVDWLVVDHYSIDEKWESAVADRVRRVLVIDDLADRSHRADALLDQNLGRVAHDYRNLVPSGCHLLIGPAYALLRPEFKQLRERSLARREAAQIRKILISLGGMDKSNGTGQVMQALQECDLPPAVEVTVVMGSTAPWTTTIQRMAAASKWKTKVLCNVSEMAQLMCESDIAIGAAGTSAWERCSMGLPSIALVLAENQREGAQALSQAGAVMIVPDSASINSMLPMFVRTMFDTPVRKQMCEAGLALVDGEGVDRVVEELLNYDRK
jgi:UDP-2,4-diacetamido-2,4,6-trideoxy-beta-L-altropyranose hydrolase